jgi:hypothetical protein
VLDRSHEGRDLSPVWRGQREVKSPAIALGEIFNGKRNARFKRAIFVATGCRNAWKFNGCDSIDIDGPGDLLKRAVVRHPSSGQALPARNHGP